MAARQLGFDPIVGILAKYVVPAALAALGTWFALRGRIEGRRQAEIYATVRREELDWEREQAEKTTLPFDVSTLLLYGALGVGGALLLGRLMD